MLFPSFRCSPCYVVCFVLLYSLATTASFGYSNLISMTLHMGTTAMDINRNRLSSVKSDSSQASYTDDFETLPANGHVNHAHIINLNEYATNGGDQGTAMLQDAVVTTLYHVSPETLQAFVSPTVNTFKAMFGKKDTQLVIWRKGLEVFVSYGLQHQHLQLTCAQRSAHSSTTLL